MSDVSEHHHHRMDGAFMLDPLLDLVYVFPALLSRFHLVVLLDVFGSFWTWRYGFT